MKYPVDMFLGVKTADWNAAKTLCEALIGHTLNCTTSTFHGGRHCHVTVDDGSFDLRLNHHDDGDGWSWCINDARYPLVLACYIRSQYAHERLMAALQRFELIELPGKY